MADTFSIDPGQAVQAQQPADATAVLAQVQPSAAGQQTLSPGQAVDQGMNQRTVDALLKLGSDLLQPAIKANAQEQFMEGVQRASTGEAVKDIVESQPWYTQLFGPSAAVAGARGYAVATQVASFGAQMEQAMPELAKQGPEALTKQLQGFMKTVMTGDAAADAAITSQIVDQMAPLYKRQAKEHYVYQQKQANQAQGEAWQAGATALQQRFAAHAKDPTMVTADDVKAEGDRFLGLLNPFPGQSDESYERNVARMAASAGDAGNFQVISLLKQRGIYDKIDPQLRTTLDGHLRGAATRTLAQLQGQPEYATALTVLFNDMTQDPAGIPAKIAALNAKAAAESGVAPEYGSLIPVQNTDNLMGRVATSQLNEQERAIRQQQTAAAKQQEAALKLARAQAFALQPGGVVSAIARGAANGGIDADDAQLVVGELFLKGQTGQERAALLNRNTEFISKTARSTLVAPVNAAEYTPGLKDTTAVYSAMDTATKGAYFSAEQVEFLDQFYSLTASGNKPEAAFIEAKRLIPLAKTWLDPNEKSAAAESIRKYVEKKYSNLVGWNQIEDQDMLVVQAAIGADLKKTRGARPMDTSVQLALGRAEASGLIEKIGGRVVSGNPVQGFKPAKDYFIQGANSGSYPAIGDAFEAALAEQAEKLNVDPKTAAIVRLPDMGGEPQFYVSAYRDDKVESFRLTGQEIRAQIGKARTAKATEQKRQDDVTKALDARQRPANAKFVGIGQYQ